MSPESRRRGGGPDGPEIIGLLELRHGPPIALRHVGHAETGIFPLPNGYCVIKPLPEKAVTGFRLVRRGHLEIRQGPDDRLTAGVKQGFFVGAVVEEKGLVVHPGLEVAAQHRQNPVLRLDFPAQYASHLREADKAL